MQLSLADRVYLVTGGGSGIGKGAAAAIVASGGNAMLIGRNADKLSAAADEIAAAGGPGSVRYEPADVTSEDEVSRAVAAATAWHGRLHGVVHSAGGSETIGPITQIDSELWRRTVDLNINGTMYLLKHAGRELVRGGGGSFVGISSIASSNTHRWFGAYGVSKAALDHLLKLAADELGPSWVRINSIRPGLTRTEMVGPIFEIPAAGGRLQGLYAAAPLRRGRGHRQPRGVPAQRRCELDHRSGDQRRRRPRATPRARHLGHAQAHVRRRRVTRRGRRIILVCKHLC